jgi:hypothetical protein
MTYKDIVLRLLRSRENLICIENHILNDFRDHENPIHFFKKWCKDNNLEYSHIASEFPPRISLKRKEFIMEKNIVD